MHAAILNVYSNTLYVNDHSVNLFLNPCDNCHILKYRYYVCENRWQKNIFFHATCLGSYTIVVVTRGLSRSSAAVCRFAPRVLGAKHHKK